MALTDRLETECGRFAPQTRPFSFAICIPYERGVLGCMVLQYFAYLVYHLLSYGIISIVLYRLLQRILSRHAGKPVLQ